MGIFVTNRFAIIKTTAHSSNIDPKIPIERLARTENPASPIGRPGCWARRIGANRKSWELRRRRCNHLASSLCPLIGLLTRTSIVSIFQALSGAPENGRWPIPFQLNPYAYPCAALLRGPRLPDLLGLKSP